MNNLKKVALAALLSTTAFGGAFAADAIGVPAPAIPAAPVVDMGSGFDWNGFYAGANVGAQNNIDLDDTDWTIGAQAGVNAQFDFFLVGAEVALDGVFAEDETYAYGSALARGGVLVTDELLAYGAIGYGTDFDSDAVGAVGDHVLAGGGLEFAATDNVSVRGQYLYGWGQDSATDNDIHKFQIGANFHF
ncbi:outer membrane protein [Pelagibacterium luteolum]|uniref:Outer membrane immunogenic protein n=1 Tax=Pelagibacterium luteolum TaxID=440168 RepID=A0A1G7WAS3_9HYPH|nr:outer membrane beta-barrel protein [Pelagibacterium luteolum]SDG68954.1 outer membrane immunogenic protein [Pelagibacterium luteolum]